MAEVPRTRTPITLEQSVKVLTEEFEKRFGRKPSMKEAAFMQAQIWLETGRGQKMVQHNAGNMIATGGWVSGGGDIWRPPWFDKAKVDALPEGSNKKRMLALHERMLKKQAPSRFRAYPSFAAGYADHVRLLAVKHPILLEAARTGDPHKFALAVRDSGYCPDCDPAKTTNTFDRLTREIIATGLLDSLPSEVTAPLPLHLTHQEQSRLVLVPGSGSPPWESRQPSFGCEGKRLGALDMPVLRQGMHSQGVRVMQTLLARGLERGLEVDGDFGPKTLRVLIHFQTIRLLTPDGVCGPKTWRKLA